MSRDNTIKTTIEIAAKIDQFQGSIKQIQDSLTKIHLDPNLKGEFNSLFAEIQNQINNISNKTKNNEIKLVDEKSARESLNKVGELYQDLINKLKDKNLTIGGLEANVASINKMKDLVKSYNTELDKSSDKLKDAQKAYDDQLKVIGNIKKAQDQAQRSVIKSEIAVKGAEEQLKITQAIGAEERKRAEDLRAELETRQNNLEVQKQLIQESQKVNTGSTRGWNATFNSLYAEEIKDVVQLEKDLAAAEELAKQKTEEGAAAREDAQAKVDKLRAKLETQRAELKAADVQYSDSVIKLKEFEQAITNIKSDAFSKIADEVNKIDWSQFDVDKVPTDFQTLSEAIAKVEQHSVQAAVQIKAQLEPALKQAAASSKNMKDGLDTAADSLHKMKSTQSDLDRLTGRLVQFFSIDNAVRLFRRAIKSAVSTIKELDAAMTETAVVTEYSISDMWKSLPDYTKRANELGLAVKDVYEASTLYYQQGLNTNEVTAVTTATLRMARIAGLEAADATDRMTNALRGFNMEITEANADNVADVYSKLAAISASNVDEISTAMTKVASLANSANMSFENTAAFLSQIIETTRESAETAGTALKTVIARFSEVKSLYSEGELLGTDAEGEEIDVNKVSKALRTAGINLNEFLTGQKGLDEIFMELAEKWDDLDIVQQRYIATIAAGSRQQSRFIALMSDYKRTVELTTAANDAAGASSEQYQKTLESVETLTNQLQNAWNEFLMGIANDEAVKFFLKTITEILNAINKLTDGISGGNGLLKAIANIGIAVGGLKLGGTFIRKMLGDPTTGAQGWIGKFILGFKGQTPAITAAGARVGNEFWAGFQQVKTADGIKSWFTKQFGKYSNLTAKELFGTSTISLETLSLSVPEKTMIQGGSDLAKSLGQQIKIAEQQALTTGDGTAYAAFKKLNQQLGQNKLSIQQLQAANKQYNLNLEATTEDIDKSSIALKNQQQAANIGGTSLLALGGIFLVISSAIEKMNGKANIVSQLLRNIGIAFMALGAVIITVSRTSSAAIMSIPIIGWITAIITLITAAVTVLVHFANKAKEEAKEAAEAVQSATEELNKAKDAIENLQTAIDELGEKEKKIEELRRGTKEWTQAIREHNDQVLQLVGTYSNLRLTNRNGLLTIENLDEVQSNMAQEVTMKNVALAGARIRANNANNNLARENFATSSIGTELTVTLQQNDDGAAMIKDVLQDIIAKEGFYGSIIDSDYVINALKELGYGTTAEILGNASEGTSSYKALNEIVNELRREQKVRIENEPDLVAFGYLISSLTDASTAVSTFADSFMNDTDRINKRLDEELKDNPAKHHHNLSDEDKKLYEEFVRDTYHTTVGSNGSFLNNGATVYYETVAKDFQTWKAADKLADQMEKYTRELERMAKDGNEQQKAIAQALSATEGNNVTIETIEQLFPDQSINWKELLTKDEKEIKEDAQFGEYFKKQWEEAADGTELKILYESAEDYVDAMYDAIIPAVDTFYKKLGNDQTGLGEQIRNLKFDAGTSKALFDKFSSVFEAGGWEELLDFNEIVKDPDKVEEFADALSKLNFRNQHDLDEFSKTLEELGIAVDNDKLEKYLIQLSEAAHSLQQIDISKFVENSKDLAKVVSDIHSGKQTRSFSEDIYNKLIEAGVDASNFTYAEDGSYLYIGEKLDDVVNAINEQTDKLTGTGRRQLEAKEAAYEIAQGIDTGIIKAGNATGMGEWRYQFTQEDEDKEYLRQVMQAYTVQGKNINDLGIDNFYNGTNLNALSAETLASIRKQFTETIVANYHTWSEQLTKLQDSDVLIEQMKHTASEIAANYGTGNEKQTEVQRAALLSKAYSAGTPEEVLNIFAENENWTQQTAAQISEVAEAYAEATELGFDTEELEAWTNQLMAANEELAKYPGVAAQVALANTKLNKGVSNLISQWDDIEEFFGENSPLGRGKNSGPLQFTSNEQAEIFKSMKENIQMALDLNEELSDAFFKEADNLEAIDKLINGTVEEKEQALEDLKKAATVDIVINSGLSEDLQQQLLNIVNAIDIPDIEVGATLNNGPLKDQLLEAIAINEEAGKKMAEALGFTIAYEETGKTRPVLMGWKTSNYQDLDGAWLSETTPIIKQVPEYAFVANGNGSGSGLSTPNLNNTGRGSSSGSSSKSKTWKNPYDELYNLQEKINSALRERELLEHRYQDMLEDHRTAGEELVDQSLQEIASLKKQLALQDQMLAGRKRQMANVADEMYEDSNGNLRSYASMGVTKYATYDEETQTVQIDWDSLEALSGVISEDQGKAIESYISRLEELRDNIQDVEDAIEEANDAIREIQQRNMDEYLDFETRVYDALVDQYQKEIDMLSDINSSVSDATTKTIDAIQEQVEKERQARENEEARQELTDKEARLAYLQRDTSGMNALEIQKLQEEIENDRQAYQDSIVDQTLQEMRDEAARAEEQRQAQIDMLNAQLDYWKDVGYPLWDQVEKLIESGMDSEGVVVSGSKLETLLKQTDDVLTMSHFGTINWQEDLAKEVASAFEGYGNWKLEEARNNGSVTIGSNTYTYNSKTNKWTDKNGNEYTIGWDQSTGSYTAQAVPKVATVSSSVQGPGTGVTPSNGGNKGEDPNKGKTTQTVKVKDEDRKMIAAMLHSYQLTKSVATSLFGSTQTNEIIATKHDDDFYKALINEDDPERWKYGKYSKYVYPIGSFWTNPYWTAYAQGGLADFTGPAWLDGTKSHPEMVLNAADTQNLISLKNILAAILHNANGTSQSSMGDNYFDINIDANISSDYDVDQLSERIKQQIYDDASYRNVNAIHYIR